MNTKYISDYRQDISEEKYNELRIIDAKLYELLYRKCDNPDGYYGYTGYGMPEDEPSVWINRVPHYSTELSETINLMKQLNNNEHIYLRRSNNMWYVTIKKSQKSKDNTCVAAGNTVSEAFCRCMLEFTTRQRNNTE